MPRIAEVALKYNVGEPDLKTRIVEYFEAHPHEVFTYRDEELCEAVQAKASAVRWTLWWLHQHAMIGRQEVGGRVYFGGFDAILELRQKLGLVTPYKRARVNAQRIKRRSGSVNVQELLDEVREDADE